MLQCYFTAYIEWLKRENSALNPASKKLHSMHSPKSSCYLKHAEKQGGSADSDLR